MSDKSARLAKAILDEDGYAQAPHTIRLHGKWHECIIGIGKDHTAKLLIDDDALAELEKMETRQASITISENVRPAMRREIEAMLPQTNEMMRRKVEAALAKDGPA